MRIDSHQHFWLYNPLEYDWIGAGMDVLRQDLLPTDLKPLIDSTGIGGTVAVQARQTLEETSWLLGLAGQYDFIKGVVGWVNLCGDDVQAQLEKFADQSRFRGLRHIIQSEPDDAFMLREDFKRGISLLTKYDLTYDILIFPRHLPAACQLVAQFPDQPFVLDHIAKPLVKEGIITPWDKGIKILASYPNVMCKVSGLVTEADWKGWRPVDFSPYLDIVFETFGVERIMFGSDWPVCLLAGSYQQVFDLFTGYTEQLSKDEKTAVWGGNAARFYGLK